MLCLCSTVYYILWFITALPLSIKGSVEIKDTQDHGHVFVKATFTWDRICLTHVNTRRICMNYVSVPNLIDTIKFNNWHYCIYIKLEKIISIFIHILKFSSNIFSKTKSTQNFSWHYSVESINFCPSVQALLKTFHVYKQKKRFVESSRRQRAA